MSASSSCIGEKAKEAKRGADIERATRDMVSGHKRDSRVVDFERQAAAHFLHPESVNGKNFLDFKEETEGMIRSGRIAVLVPMREKGGAPYFVPREVVRYLVKNAGFPQDRVFVINHLSELPAVDEAKRWNVPVISAMKVIALCEPKLVAICNVDRLERGKGVAMLAGLLYIYRMKKLGMLKDVEYVLMHDAELIDVDEYDPARSLVWPLVANPGAYNMVLAAQVGRNNEPSLAARVGVDAIRTMHPDKVVRDYLDMVWQRVVSYVWMLCGERIIRLDDFFGLPITTHYGLETILGWGFAGLNAQDGSEVAQVAILKNRFDSANTTWGEQFMMYNIARVNVACAMMGTPPSEWTVDDIRRLNKHTEEMFTLPVFPFEHGPMISGDMGMDRFVPSVNKIYQMGLVDLEGLDRRIELLRGRTKYDFT